MAWLENWSWAYQNNYYPVKTEPPATQARNPLFLFILPPSSFIPPLFRSFPQSAVLRVCPRIDFMTVSRAPIHTEVLGLLPRPNLLYVNPSYLLATLLVGVQRLS
jgi:hypothetical protein